MSACAAVYSVAKNRHLSGNDIDVILQHGDNLYMSVAPTVPQILAGHTLYLQPEELPTEIRVENYVTSIENMNDNWIANGLFPESLSQKAEAELALKLILQRQVFNSGHNDNTDSILFTGQSYTVAFWRFDGTYYLFNSHSVDSNNETDSSNGVARLFKCNTELELARLLFSRGLYSQQYSLNRLRVIDINSERLMSPDIISVSSQRSYADVLRTPTLPSSVESVTDCSGQSPKPKKICKKPLSPRRYFVKSPANDSQSPFRGFLTTVDVQTKPEELTDREWISTLSQSILDGLHSSFVQIDQSQSILDSIGSRLSSLSFEYREVTATTNSKTAVSPKKSKKKTVDVTVDANNPVVDENNMFAELRLDDEEFVSVSSSSSSSRRGRPKKVKRGPKKTKENAHLDAVKKYNAKKPEINRKSVSLYQQNKPVIHLEKATKYSKNNPKVHRESVAKYALDNPEINRLAVAKYNSKNPNINKEAVKTYTKSHSNERLDSATRYNEQNPEINKKAVLDYTKNSRNVDVSLRRLSNLIGQLRDADLKKVPLFSLKKPSLLSADAHRCRHCNARLFYEETSRVQWCCGSGAYNIQNFTPLTEDFYSDPSFVNKARAYNNLFAFSALGVSHGYHHPPGLSFLKIQGRIYHRVFDLAYDRTINNLGLYIHDSSEREREALKLNLDLQITQSITHYLHNVNPFIECFKRLSLETSDQAFIQFQRTTRATHGNILGDLPVGKEVAAILSTERESYVPRCIAVWKIGESRPHTVDIMHPLYESFQYPLLYPEGNAGWYPNKLDNNGSKITQNKYVRCLLLSEPRFSRLSRLSEEWLVDMYCRIVEERLRYYDSMQKHSSDSALRSAPLEEVVMNIEARNQIRHDETIQGEGIVPGRVYLPSSFTGGPRYMKTKYCDAIALVNRLGNPSFFLTFTCNPKWPEIQQSTTGNYSNHLVCARAFNLRLAELLKDIRSGLWFGKCVYMLHVIEFQKRGLPHAHICFRVEGGGPASNIDIDKFVRADIPNELEAGGRLRKTVLNHMIHGPCGPPNRVNLPCWDLEKRKCTKYFPKRETATTFSDEKGFIHLRRDKNNKGIIKYRNQEITVDETWVVPYNASMLLKYDAHINLEISTQRTVVKYLFKYITKGPDESRVAVVPEEHINNEIEQYATKRYVGSSDAAWRTLEFDVTAREPTVKQLSVHLPNQQSVFFKPGTEAQAVAQAGSDLITYFNRPVGDEFDRLTYLDFYEKYIIHSKRPSTKNAQILETSNHKFITKRQRGELVARLFWVAPNRGEQFYLRILVKSFPCRSYTDLFNLGGSGCTTFQEAAKTVGLADDEIEYERAMLEACAFLTAARLRRFFVMLAVNGVPVATLWNKFKNEISEDISHRIGIDDMERVYTLCLIQIGRMLRKHGASLAQHGLPEVTDDTTELGRERIEYNVESLENRVNECRPRLSADQTVIFDYVAKLLSDTNFRDANKTAIFVDGPAGTGKTYLLKLISSYVRGNLKGVVLCTASSAIAAQNYEGGSTAHSMFKFPIDLLDDLGYWSITNGSQRAELISNATLIIYDEAPMAHKYLIHLLDRSLRDLMRNEKIFGGKIVIFAGDFRQIPPVVVSAKTNSDILNASVKTSTLWIQIKTFALVTSQRCKDDLEFADFLLKLGSNELATVSVDLNTHSMVELSGIDIVTELNDLIDFVFPFIDEPSACIHRAILCTRNDAVREINNIILDRLQGDLLHFYSVDKFENEESDQFFLGPDMLNELNPKGIPVYDLQIKIGCVCMIIRNLSFADGLVNGTKVIVTATSPRLITVQKAGNCDEYLIPRIMFKAPINVNSPFEMTRRQFPLQLCYAMTIHKSQGQTIARVGVDLRSDMFSHGQLYVALGRVTDKNCIKILIHPDRVLNGKPFAKNIIIPELL